MAFPQNYRLNPLAWEGLFHKSLTAVALIIPNVHLSALDLTLPLCREHGSFRNLPMNRKENIIINSSALGFNLCCDVNLLHPETREQLRLPKPWDWWKNLYSLLFEKKKSKISQENVMYLETRRRIY